MALWRYYVYRKAQDGRLPARTYGRCYTADHTALFDQRTTTINPPREMVGHTVLTSRTQSGR
jgi:hypothetical protein